MTFPSLSAILCANITTMLNQNGEILNITPDKHVHVHVSMVIVSHCELKAPVCLSSA